ncbi:MAG: metallophosphoesterase [Elusimicrobiota bacterium]|jgi:3',5'-cyclic AMP phosphodiesterase CpdA|nr:metallophosphoesterase [Elusimicrobiota bacterium]
MKNFFFAAALLAAACGLNAANIIRGPYVEDAEQTTAVIKWATDVPTPAWIEYGPEGKCSQLMAVASKREEHSLTLHGLIPNTKFCYKIYVMNADETGTQEPAQGTFKTLYSAERKIVNFLVVGNTSSPHEGSTDEIKRTAAQSMSGYEADFIVHTGNIAADGTASGNNADFFIPFAPALQNAALLAALGEDEYGPNRNAEKEGRGFLAANYRRIHTMPWSKGTPYYYYIDTANARLIFLDTNFVYGVPNASKLELKSSQYEWLKNALSTADSASWKIVVLHHPVYSSGPVPDKLSAMLAPLFEAYKVKLVIQGRQGAYERTAPIIRDQKAGTGQTGPIYITVGGGGKLFEKKEFYNEWSSKYFEVPHFAHIQIVDRKLSLRVYTHDNKRIDALDIYF